MSDKETSRPSFSAPLYAALRQGHKELAEGMLPAFPDSVRPVHEPGTLGSPTAQMVTEQIGSVYGYDKMLDRYAGHQVERNEPEQEMER